MLVVVSEFLGITGVSAIVPSNLAELIPYMLNVFISVVLVTAVFRVLSAILKGLAARKAVR